MENKPINKRHNEIVEICGNQYTGMWCVLNIVKVLHMMKMLELFVCFAAMLKYISGEFATGKYN